MSCVYVLYISNDGTAPGKNIKKSGTSKVNDETLINVLSFDGGGSRGVMEIFILKDVMNMATILKNELDRFIFPHNKEDCVKLREILRNVKKPIHPTEVFEFIVGLEKLLESYFDDITLAYFPKPHGCIVGAVARQIFEKKPDKMVLFTSGNDDHRLVTRILKASADAPILFQTPFLRLPMTSS